MGFGEIELLAMVVKISQGDYVLWLPFENFEQIQDFGGYLVLLCGDFKVVYSLVHAAVLNPFTGCHPSPLKA